MVSDVRCEGDVVTEVSSPETRAPCTFPILSRDRSRFVKIPDSRKARVLVAGDLRFTIPSDRGDAVSSRNHRCGCPESWTRCPARVQPSGLKTAAATLSL